MSYKLVKDGISGILEAQGLTQSKETDNFKSAGANEHEKTFILNVVSGAEDPVNEVKQALLRDDQKWTVQVAYSKTVESALVQQDAINLLRDILLVKLDNPANWESFCSILRYKSWKIQELKSYFVLTIELKVVDSLTY